MDQQVPNPENSPSHAFLVYLSLAVMAVIIAMGGYFLGLQQSVDKKGTETAAISLKPQAKLTAGLQKAQNAIQNSNGLLTQTKISQTYTGVLKSMIADKSFTLEKGGKAITLRNDNNKKVSYFIRRDEPNAKLNPTTPDNIKIGNNVLVTVSFSVSNPAKTDVERVILILPASPSPQSPTSSTSASNAASPASQ